MTATELASPRTTTPLHWPEYLIEAGGLGLFMFIACTFGVILGQTGSWGERVIADPTLRRMVFGIAMGVTAMGIIYSPWGQRSGAHLNPATTLTFLRLRKVRGVDAICYPIAQALGGVLGVALAALIYGDALADPSVHYVVTQPGVFGSVAAFGAELAISFGLMTVVLIVSNSSRFKQLTGMCAGLLVATYITLEAPISGMSMNPARSFASAAVAQDWTSIWVYFTAPVLGMLLAAEVYVRHQGSGAVRCAKLHHSDHGTCIFRCAYREGAAP